MSKVSEAAVGPVESRRRVHSAVDGLTYALEDALELTEAQRVEVKEALTELAGSILDLARMEQVLR